MVTDEKDIAIRLDLYLSERMGLTRSFIQKLINEGHVRINSRSRIKPSLRVKPGQTICVSLPPAQELEVIPEPVPFNVVYEDSDILVINKPAGVVVHPAPGNWHGTLVHGLLYRFPDIGIFNNVIRPGIVHRLDAQTSGLMVIARNNRAMEDLQMKFKNREIRKEYIALVKGKPSSPSGTLDLPIGRNARNRMKMSVRPGGKPSMTEYRVIWSRENSSLVQCTLLTGRTHQIRVHMKHIGCPLVGDTLYGPKKTSERSLNRIFLHSWKLEFNHPVKGESLSFTQPLPEELILFLRGMISSKRDLSAGKMRFYK
ncbi:MAG: RluA family pseudouridine synthase [Synergistales bacterium]|nr:RluA family pseudouridine synthase [Synergistales bacterium]